MTNKTNVQRLARERQKETGEKYTKCLAYVRAHQDELIPEYIARRRQARNAEPETPPPSAPRQAERSPRPPDDRSSLSIRFLRPARSPTRGDPEYSGDDAPPPL